METINFIIEGEPEPQQRPRTFFKGGRAWAHSPKPKFWDICYNSLLKGAVYFKRKGVNLPLDGALRVDMVFCLKKPKNTKIGEFWANKRPDKDNIEKLVLDCLTKANIIRDDSIVCAGDIMKIYNEPAGVLIKIKELTDKDIFSVKDWIINDKKG